MTLRRLLIFFLALLCAFAQVAKYGGSSSGGGGGNSTTTGTYGSNPGSCTDGDVRFPTDSFYLLRCASNSWIRWGPIFPMSTVPACATFTDWVNQGTAACTDSGGAAYFQQPTIVGTQIRGKVLTAPATPYTVVAQGLVYLKGGGNQRMAPILLRESGTGKIVTFGYFNPQLVYVDCWASATAYTSSPYSSASHNLSNVAVKFKMTADGTNLVYSISADGGLNYETVLSHAKTTCFTTAPDQIGFGGDTEGGPAGTTSMTLTEWRTL